MLKIKDNIDLKELEKYGFKLEYDLLYSKTFDVKDLISEHHEYEYNAEHSINIYLKDKSIKLDICNNDFTYHCFDEELGRIEDTLYDLIKDGLVEKVKDE